MQFCLVDSIGKKLKVVNAIAEALALENVRTRHLRAEAIRDQQFDFAVSRAVAPLKDLWQWARPLLRPERKMEKYKNGLLCLKGGDLAQEVSESRLRPHVQSIEALFPGKGFGDKYLLYVPV